MENEDLLKWLREAFVLSDGNFDRQIQIASALAVAIQTKALASMYEDVEYESRKGSNG